MITSNVFEDKFQILCFAFFVSFGKSTETGIGEIIFISSNVFVDNTELFLMCSL